MKKFALVLLIALLCLPVLAFAACADPADDPYDLSTKEIGYEIPVYPDCDFSYVVKWDEWNSETSEEIEKSCTVKITNFRATLVEKHTISEGDILEDNYANYTVKLHAEGQTDISAAGEYLRLLTKDAQGASMVNNDGSIIWDFEYSFSGSSEYYIFEYVLREIPPSLHSSL